MCGRFSKPSIYEQTIRYNINILSPAYYEEFARTLKDDGILIKVVSGSNYLKELRDVLYDGTSKQSYSNEKVIEHYSKNFTILDMRDIVYNSRIDKEDLMHLIKMTPLSWSAADERIKQAINMGTNNITVDFTIIVGKKM